MSDCIPSIAAAALALVFVSPASAAPRRHHHAAMRASPAPTQMPVAMSRPYSFYPQDVEGGVSGNLSFNNQIRKHTDPLNANGGR